MRAFYRGLSLLVITVACTSTMETKEGWVYQSESLSPDKEAKRFQKDLAICNEKRDLAEQTNREYNLDVDPQGAFELCMRSKGWQPASELNSISAPTTDEQDSTQ